MTRARRRGGRGRPGLRGRPGGRGGFTLIELITVVLVLGILAGIAVPRLRGAVSRADAARVMSDVRNITLVLAQYMEETGSPPTGGTWGQPPPALVEELGGVAFAYKDLEYRLETRSRGEQVLLRIRYPADDPVGVELARFRRDDGSVVWTRTRMDFLLHCEGRCRSGVVSGPARVPR